MALMLLTALVLVAIATALAFRALALGRISAAARLAEIQTYGFGNDEVAPPPQRGLGSALDETASRLGRFVALHFGGFREEQVRAFLRSAGIYNVSPLTFLGYRVLATLGLPALFLWLLLGSGTSAGLVVAGTAISLAAGWILPMTYVRRRIDARIHEIERDLPELIDLLVLTVEAGIGFNSSLQMASQRLRGALGAEVRLTLQEQSLGLSTNEALQNLLARCDTPSMRSFVRSMIQGESLGVSIGQILRNLSREIRVRRRQAAEEKAQKAPVKILFPLVFLIFPPIFIVLLYPAIQGFKAAFG